jgi:hypothetical protein
VPNNRVVSMSCTGCIVAFFANTICRTRELREAVRDDERGIIRG